MKLTIYKIKRDHDNKTGFFIVNVPEANQLGVGFQARIGEYVYGISLVCVSKEKAP